MKGLKTRNRLKGLSSTRRLRTIRLTLAMTRPLHLRLSYGSSTRHSQDGATGIGMPWIITKPLLSPSERSSKS